MTNFDLNAFDVDVASSRSSKGVSDSFGRNRDSKFVCWCCEKGQ